MYQYITHKEVKEKYIYIRDLQSKGEGGETCRSIWNIARGKERYYSERRREENRNIHDVSAWSLSERHWVRQRNAFPRSHEWTRVANEQKRNKRGIYVCMNYYMYMYMDWWLKVGIKAGEREYKQERKNYSSLRL